MIARSAGPARSLRSASAIEAPRRSRPRTRSRRSRSRSSSACDMHRVRRRSPPPDGTLVVAHDLDARRSPRRRHARRGPRSSASRPSRGIGSSGRSETASGRGGRARRGAAPTRRTRPLSGQLASTLRSLRRLAELEPSLPRAFTYPRGPARRLASTAPLDVRSSAGALAACGVAPAAPDAAAMLTRAQRHPR